jgi:hypothetical protein
MKLQACRNELQSIITEMQRIEQGIRRDFRGVGQDKCADGVARMIAHYRRVLITLNSVRENILTK